MTARALDAPGSAQAPQRFGPGAPGFADFELGASTLQDALRLAESPGSEPSVLLLLRTAVLALLRARQAQTSDAQVSPQLPDDSWAWLREQPDTGPLLEQLPAERRALLQRLLLQPVEVPALAELTAAGRQSCLITLRRLAVALGDPLQKLAAAAVRQRHAHRLRVAGIAGGSLLVLGALFFGIFSRPNLALHKPVLVETSDPQLAISPEQVVDGDRTNLGFHTLRGGAHSVLIDLQAPQRIRSVHVYNRIDCCLERAIPLSVEVSSDGQHFRHVAHRARRFALWKAKFPPVEARWVRLVHLGSAEFHLSEIEVY